MKRLIANRKRTVLTFAVMFLIYGITSLGFAHETANEGIHFEDDSTTRTVAAGAALGTLVGDPVVAHNFGGISPGDEQPIELNPLVQGTQAASEAIHYALPPTDTNWDWVSFRIDKSTGQIRVGRPLDRTSYSVTVSIDKIQTFFEAEGKIKTLRTALDTIDVTITVGSDTTAEADALQTVSSEERSRIAAALAMDRVIFNELRNSTTDTHDWVELRNISDADVTLDGWQVHIVTDEGTGIVTFPSGTVLPAGGLLLLVNTDPDAPEMPLSIPEGTAVSLVDAELILPQTNFTLLLRSDTGWEDSVGNYFFGHEIPPTAPPLTTDAAWYRARPDALGYQAEAWVVSGYQDGTGYDEGVAAASALGTPGYPQASLMGDVNADGTVNILDLVFVASRFGEADAMAADLNGDGSVNIQDLVLVANSLGSVAAAPSAQALHASHVQQWVESAKQAVAARTIETSVAAQPYSYERGIQVLEALLATLVPQSTALLANYPNPFNPETWIPYRLAKGSDVQISIYDTQGRLVRHLDIGHQAAGVYQTRSRAAYWDGTNEMGEAVASGLYFYTLTAGEFSATRKMLILK